MDKEIIDLLTEIAANAEPLGEEFERIWDDNLLWLVSVSDPEWGKGE